MNAKHLNIKKERRKDKLLKYLLGAKLFLRSQYSFSLSKRTTPFVEPKFSEFGLARAHHCFLSISKSLNSTPFCSVPLKLSPI
jgi:hypothetical protein